MDTTYNNSDLVLLIKENNKDAFNYLYANYRSALVLVIYRIVSDSHTTEDILQDVFVSIWKNINQYDPTKGCFYTWMRIIAKNKAIDFTRTSVHGMRKRTCEQDENNYIQATTETEHKTNHIGISKLVTALSPQYENLINLIYYKGHTMEEIAISLNIPLGTIKTRVRKAICLLREDFKVAM